jgi:hypothetical protein
MRNRAAETQQREGSTLPISSVLRCEPKAGARQTTFVVRLGGDAFAAILRALTDRRAAAAGTT